MFICMFSAARARLAAPGPDRMRPQSQTPRGTAEMRARPVLAALASSRTVFEPRCIPLHHVIRHCDRVSAHDDGRPRPARQAPRRRRQLVAGHRHYSSVANFGPAYAIPNSAFSRCPRLPAVAYRRRPLPPTSVATVDNLRLQAARCQCGSRPLASAKRRGSYAYY